MSQTFNNTVWWLNSFIFNKQYVENVYIVFLLFFTAGDCSDPPSIGNGFVISVAPYTDGTSAIYTCQTGYDMTGDADGVVCTSSDTWTGTAPTCSDQLTTATSKSSSMLAKIKIKAEGVH